MDQIAKFVEAFRRLKKKGDCFFYATVTEITGNTCSAKLGDLELTDIKLKATTRDDEDKLILTPKVGSSVILGCNDEDLRDVMIIKVDDPEKIFYKHKDITIDIDGSSGNIVINKGDNGGLINIEKLVDRLNSIEDYVKQFRTKYDSHTHPETGTATSPPLSTGLMNIDPTKSERDPLEDKKVKH
ncbi:MAG: hypothetical protein NTU51_05895 [Bacteroidetes bacterium]|nr:hypothetical protein [Bacteroidota bacterium]